MNQDQGKRVKRKDDGDASLPPDETQEERMNNQGAGQQHEETSDDVPMADVVVATRSKVIDDQAKLKKLHRIKQKVLSDHSDPRFLNNWNGLHPAKREGFLEQALRERRTRNNVSEHF